MKYYIDFEATQYTQQIMEIGCVDENGREFHGLIRHKKVGKFVEALTGLTPEKLMKAPEADDTLKSFFKWVLESPDQSAAQFYCYGDSDFGFVKNTKKRAYTQKSQMILDFIAGNIYDISSQVREYFGIVKNVALIKVANYFDASLTQDHNALHDARLLKFICEKMKEKPCEDDPFPEYKEKYVAYDRGVKVAEFYGIIPATTWLIENQDMRGASFNNIQKRIINSAKNGQSYCGFMWEIS